MPQPEDPPDPAALSRELGITLDCLNQSDGALFRRHGTGCNCWLSIATPRARTHSVWLCREERQGRERKRDLERDGLVELELERRGRRRCRGCLLHLLLRHARLMQVGDFLSGRARRRNEWRRRARHPDGGSARPRVEEFGPKAGSLFTAHCHVSQQYLPMGLNEAPMCYPIR